MKYKIIDIKAFIYSCLPYDLFVKVIQNKYNKMKYINNRYKQAKISDYVCVLVDYYTIRYNLYDDKLLNRIWKNTSLYLENENESFNI